MHRWALVVAAAILAACAASAPEPRAAGDVRARIDHIVVNLAPLGTRDAAAANLLNTLDFKEPK